MTREIKFRAWDKDRKCMDRWDKIDSPLLTFDGQLVTTLKTGGTKLFDRNYILMQCTGRQIEDKDLYESDIVGYRCERYEVKWVGSGFWLVHSELQDIEPTDEICKNLKLLGNKWENPELLK